MNFTLSSSEHSHFLPSSSEMNAYDAETIASGVRSIDLVEKAGEAVYNAIKERISTPPRQTHVLVLAGHGNNGSDGFVIARLLRRAGFIVEIVTVLSESYSANLLNVAEKYLSFGGELFVYPATTSLIASGKNRGIDKVRVLELLLKSEIVVDALLGTGQGGEPRGFVGELVELFTERVKIKGSKCFTVFSVDVPTGVNCDTGMVYERHINAHTTISIEFIKRGLIQYPALDACGELLAVGVGITSTNHPDFTLFSDTEFQITPARHPNSHKGDSGSILVVGGSRDMPGAPLLTARSALRSGAGRVTMVKLPSMSSDWPEIIHRAVHGQVDHLSEEAVPDIEDMVPRISAAVLGPGLGTHSQTSDFLLATIELLTARFIPFVIDADGLNLISSLTSKGRELDLSGAVLTPHPGEMARLLGSTIAEVESDRYRACKELCRRTKSVVVLKGASTVIYGGSRGVVNTSGTPFLATPGSGDVLSGVIGYYLGIGYSQFSAACCAVHAHGIAGRNACKKTGGPIIASDIIDAIPTVIGGTV